MQVIVLPPRDAARGRGRGYDDKSWQPWYNYYLTFRIRTTIVVRTENLRSVLRNFSELQLLQYRGPE